MLNNFGDGVGATFSANKLLFYTKIRLKESHDKYRYLKKLTSDFAAVVYLSEAPSPPRFLFGVV
jgi:hypothetical protein